MRRLLHRRCSLARVQQSCRITEVTELGSSIFAQPPANPIETLDIDGKKLTLGLLRQDQYEYDGQGRVNRVITKAVPTAAVEGRTVTFEYPPNQVTETQFYPNGQESKTTYTVNEYGNTLLLTSGYKFEFNSDGFIIKTKYAYSTGKDWAEDGVDENTIENGNIVKTTTSQPQKGRYSTSLYEYDLTKPNLPVIYWFYTKTSKNLLTKATHYQGKIGSTDYIIVNFRYLFDKTGQVSRRITITSSYNAANQKVGENTYTVTDFKVSCQ